jgi:hypothetical protein
MIKFTRRVFLLFAGAVAATRASAQAGTPFQAAEQVLKDVSGVGVRPYSTRDFGRERYAAGRSVLVPEDSAGQLLAEVRKRLPQGTLAYVGVTNDLSTTTTSPNVELAVVEGKNQFDILRAAATDGANYQLDTDAIIKELKTWDSEFGIDIWQAETDTIQLRLKRLPKDVPVFAKRVYKFCPDIVDQGVGSVSALAKDIAGKKALTLWWD